MKSIKFNDEMVRAILDGRKTQTRRPVKPQPITPFDRHALNVIHKECPYGKVSDQLWVREAWAAWDSVDSPEASEVEYAIELMPEYGIGRHHCGYRANLNEHADRWRPSIHMPRWASRITLEITAVRVQRVQDIGAADARAEGCGGKDGCADGCLCDDDGHVINRFRHLWDSIYGGTEFAWASNPWVWVIQFEVANG